MAELTKHVKPWQHLQLPLRKVCLVAEQGLGCAMQDWQDAKPNQTAVPFKNEYFVRGTRSPILKQNVGMFRPQEWRPSALSVVWHLQLDAVG